MARGGSNKIDLSREQVTDLVTRYQSGDSHRKIAKAVGLTNTVVYNALKAEGVIRSRKQVVKTFVVKRLMYVSVGATTAQEAIDEAKKLDMDFWATVPNTYRAMPLDENQKRLIEGK